jgi:hypothetical protein
MPELVRVEFDGAAPTTLVFPTASTTLQLEVPLVSVTLQLEIPTASVASSCYSAADGTVGLYNRINSLTISIIKLTSIKIRYVYL